MCEGIIADQKMNHLIQQLYENQIKLDVTEFLRQTEEKVRKARLGQTTATSSSDGSNAATNSENNMKETILRMKSALQTVLIPVFMRASRQMNGIGANQTAAH